MARKNVNWTAVVAEFIRLHPRTSASIAFQLGIVAAQAANKVVGARKMTDIPSRLIELAPSMADLGGYLPDFTGRKRKKPVVKRRKTHAGRQASKLRS